MNRALAIPAGSGRKGALAFAVVGRLTPYLELTKPRIAVMVLFTVAAGALLAGVEAGAWAVVLHVVVGTALVACGASVLNQLLERNVDARMHRTANRPLPTGRLLPVEALILGTALGVAGAVYLGLTVQRPLSAGLAAVAFVGYAFVYTPLKRVTVWNTIIGAVPGAMPPLIGWAAVADSFGAVALLLFLILFLWQAPHFYAIAWMYREDYARAGFRMLPVVDETGRRTSRQMVLFCLGLLAVSLGPWVFGLAPWWYGLGAGLLGLLFLAAALAFARQRTIRSARRVLRVSLLYLPALLGLLVFALLDGSR